jgi:hypothetical protein
MTDFADPTDEQLLCGMTAFLVGRHGADTLPLVDRRIEELTYEGDELALALLRGVADELRRMACSAAKH